MFNVVKTIPPAADSLIVLFRDAQKIKSSMQNTSNAFSAKLASDIEEFLAVDNSAAASGTHLVLSNDAPGKRIILAPIGNKLYSDTGDVRDISSAARGAVKRAIASGSRNPVMSFAGIQGDESLQAGSLQAKLWQTRYSKIIEATLLGVAQELYEPLQAREALGAKVAEPLDSLQILLPSDQSAENIINNIKAIEAGRRIARDIGGSDPERMAPLKCAEYLVEAFKDSTNVKLTVISDPAVLLKEYPLLHAVTRASLVVPRHMPCVVRLEYTSPTPADVKENLFFIGKGVTYDTGGADLKVGGAMRGMSRDKCGASGVAGFMKTVSMLKPTRVNIVAECGFVRNSIGPDAYVSDEIITSRAGVRCLIGNTDAEGRMVMGDILCKLKEEALVKAKTASSIPNRLFTVATLTGHSIRACGHYSVLLENGPAKMDGVAKRIYDAGELFGEPCEITSLRKDDFKFVSPGAKTEDVIQANSAPSTMTSRGHQYPMAFLSISSGIDKCGLDAENSLSYTHLDIAGSAEEAGASGLGLPKTTGAPISALTGAFLLS